MSREKEKEEAMEREMLNVCPMLVSAWQKSRHLVTRAGSSPLTAADIMFTDQGHIGEVLGVVKITATRPHHRGGVVADKDPEDEQGEGDPDQGKAGIKGDPDQGKAGQLAAYKSGAYMRNHRPTNPKGKQGDGDNGIINFLQNHQ